jgi:hypothetical protein
MAWIVGAPRLRGEQLLSIGDALSELIEDGTRTGAS